ncbi:iron ABC transporter permease [Micromonospora sp. WMMD1128]|uniref:ABC transporter permease n=1 Tax=Micromonospora sp. WMMD1128 TaxID=3015150 RepID=UPI00248C4254|nr:iron ABC transporter permease [Micromonospora sp. WMMD1128]WBB75631.1 iron ABC transporter permease [Micromonospora sp. WMMD1128]
MVMLAPPGPDAEPEISAPARAARRRITPFTTIAVTVATVLAVLATYPILRVAVGLVYVDGRLTVEPIRDVLAVPDLVTLIVNTLVAVVVSGVVALVVGSILAWLNERTDARVAGLTDSMPMIPFLLPPIAGAVGWVLLLSTNAGLLNAFIRWVLGGVGIELTEGPFDIFSWPGLIFVYTLYQVPYVFMLVTTGLRNADASLDEQSRISGAGRLKTLWRVTLPAIRPSIGGAILLMCWQGFSLYSVPVIIGSGAGIDVISVRIVDLLSFTYPPETATAVGLSFIVLLFVGVMWYLQSRMLRSGRHATVGGKGQRFTRQELGGWKWPARLLILGYGALAVVLPAIGLLLVSLNGFWTPKINWTGLSLDSVRESVFEDGQTLTAVQNSLWLGIAGATIGMVAAALVALLVVRSKRRAVRALDGAIKLPSVFSHLVIAVGMILAFGGPPFYLGGTTMILLLAYISIYLPQGSVAADSAASQVGGDLAEASQISGAGGGKTFRRVYLPLMVPGLVAGWAFLFARMVGDLTATAVLAGTTNMVVGFRILQIFENGSYAELASLSVVLTAVTALVVGLCLAYSRWQGRWQGTGGRTKGNR